MSNSSPDQENNNTPLNSQQRKLCYRDLLNRVEGIEENEDLGLGVVEELGNIIRQVNFIESQNDISERYQFPEETLLDSMVLSSASKILVKCIESVDVNTCTYDPTEFANKIVQSVQSDEEFTDEHFLKLLEDAQTIIPEVPECNFVYGTYDFANLPLPKKKKERQKQEKERVQKKEPEKVTSLEKEERGIDEIVKVLYEVLVECYGRHGEQAVRYYDYVVDTSSFSNTIENIFYCSFLVRDGKAHIDIDKSGSPYIKPMKKKQLKEFRDQGGVNFQVIPSISMAEWESFKKQGYIQRYKSKK